MRIARLPRSHSAYQRRPRATPRTRARPLCIRCLETSFIFAAVFEDASNKLVYLDAYLAASGLRRDPVAADGTCLFAAVSRTTAPRHRATMQEMMRTPCTFDFCGMDRTLSGADARLSKQEVTNCVRQRLRRDARWDITMREFVWRLSMNEKFSFTCILL